MRSFIRSQFRRFKESFLMEPEESSHKLSRPAGFTNSRMDPLCRRESVKPWWFSMPNISGKEGVRKLASTRQTEPETESASNCAVIAHKWLQPFRESIAANNTA